MARAGLASKETGIGMGGAHHSIDRSVERGWRWLWRVLMVLALLLALRAMRHLLLPPAMALALAFALAAPVRRLRAAGVPEPLGAGLVVGGLAAALLLLAWSLAAPVAVVMAEAPAAIERVLARWRTALAGFGGFAFDVPALSRALVEAALEAALLIAATGVLLYFMLLSHRAALDALLALRLAPRRRALLVGGLRQAEREIGIYLRTMTALNFGLGAATGLALAAIGLPHATLWAVVTAVLCFVPYAGPAAVTLLLGFVGHLYGGSAAMEFAPPLLFLALHAVEANLLGPWLMGASLRLNTLAVLLAVLAFGWAWGLGGGLLALPVLIGVRATLRRHAPLRRWQPLLLPFGDTRRRALWRTAPLA